MLAHCIKEAKKRRQVIIVTHNPNLAVGADAEQVIHVELDKSKGYKFIYKSGAICPSVSMPKSIAPFLTISTVMNSQLLGNP